MIDGEPHDAVVGGSDIRAQRCADIFTVVRIARLTVHDANAAEDTGALAAHRLDEAAVP